MGKNQCVMAVTKDAYELPIAIANSYAELDRMLNLPKDTSNHLVKFEGKRIIKYNFKVCLVNLEEGVLAG